MKLPVVTFARPPKRAAKARKPSNLGPGQVVQTVVKAYSPQAIKRWQERYGDRWREMIDGDQA